MCREYGEDMGKSAEGEAIFEKALERESVIERYKLEDRERDRE